MKIRPMEAELFQADGLTDGQTDMTKLTVAFRNFAKAPKKGKTEELRREREKENKEETNDIQEKKGKFRKSRNEEEWTVQWNRLL